MADDYRNMSSVELGMSLLKQTKEETERERKRREKLDRKYGMAKLLTSGLKYMVKERFNAFENDMMPQKAQLQHIYNKAQDVLETQNTIDSNYDGNSLAYWTDFYKNQFANTAAELYPDYNQALLTQYYIGKAEEKARQKDKEWAGIVSEAKDIPTNVKDLESQWSRYAQSQVPNNVFGWATRGIKNFLSGKSKQEIEQEGKTQRQLFLNSNYFKEYGELERAYEQQERVNPSTVRQDFEALFSSLDDEKKKGLQQIIGSPKVDSFTSGGITYRVRSFEVADRTAPYGRRLVEEVIGQTRSGDQEVKIYTDNDRETVASYLDAVWERSNADYNKKRDDLGFHNTVLITMENMRKLNLGAGLDDQQLAAEAADHLLKGGQANITSFDEDSMTLAAIPRDDKEKREKHFEGMLNRVTKYQAEAAMYDQGAGYTSNRIYTNLYQNIDALYDDEYDKKIELIEDLNEIFLGEDQRGYRIEGIDLRPPTIGSPETDDIDEGSDLETISFQDFKGKVKGIIRDEYKINPQKNRRGNYEAFDVNTNKFLGTITNRNVINYLDNYFGY